MDATCISLGGSAEGIFCTCIYGSTILRDMQQYYEIKFNLLWTDTFILYHSFPTVSITVLNSEVVELLNAYYIRKVDGKLHLHHLLITT